MKWFAKSHELCVFLVLFVLVNDGVRGDERNRMDAEKDPYEKVTLNDDGAVRSALFSSCLAASNTLEVKLYSIEIPGTTKEFIRYVPDSWQLSMPSEWKTVTSVPPVAKITDCATAAHREGNAMFMYSGGSDCKVSNQAYDLMHTPACEAEVHDTVFISSLAAVACKLPFIQVGPGSGPTNSSDCIEINQQLMSMSPAEAELYCKNINALQYKPTGRTSYEVLLNIFHRLGVNSGIFFVAGPLLFSGQWDWNFLPVNRSLFIRPPPDSGTYTIFLNASNNFMIDFCVANDCRGGAVCMLEDQLP